MFLLCNFKPHFISFLYGKNTMFWVMLTAQPLCPISGSKTFTLSHMNWLLLHQKLHYQIDQDLYLMDTYLTFVAHRMEELLGSSPLETVYFILEKTIYMIVIPWVKNLQKQAVSHASSSDSQHFPQSNINVLPLYITFLYTVLWRNMVHVYKKIIGLLIKKQLFHVHILNITRVSL